MTQAGEGQLTNGDALTSVMQATAGLNGELRTLTEKELLFVKFMIDRAEAGATGPEVNNYIRDLYPAKTSNKVLSLNGRRLVEGINRVRHDSVVSVGKTAKSKIYWYEFAPSERINNGASPFDGSILKALKLAEPRPDWESKARCHGEETNTFYKTDEADKTDDKFDDDDSREKAAIAICRSCDVCSDCGAYALATREEWGIWGGLTEKKRRKLLKQTGKTPVVNC